MASVSVLWENLKNNLCKVIVFVLFFFHSSPEVVFIDILEGKRETLM